MPSGGFLAVMCVVTVATVLLTVAEIPHRDVYGCRSDVVGPASRR